MVTLLWIFVLVRVSSSYAIESDSVVDWKKWVSLSEFSLYPTLPIAAPLSENEKCREESRKLITHLKNKTLWAVQMWDSSATTGFGLLHGNKYNFGNYDECLRITKPIKAQYCLTKIKATVHLKEALEGDPYDVDPPLNVSVWKKFEDSHRDFSKYDREEVQWGLCVPSSCNAIEMEKAINLYLEELNLKFLEHNGTTYNVEIPENYCSDGSEEEYTYGEIGFWLFTWIILILVGIATSIDLKKNKEGPMKDWKATKLLMSFSIKQNLKRLLASENDPNTNHLKFLHGVRCISMTLIVVDHHVAIFLSAAMFNRQSLEEALRSHQKFFLPHGDLLVDTFFFISGFLVTYMLFNALQKRRLNAFVVIIHRFIRLAPLYFYIVWFQASAFLRMGSGPGWQVGLHDEVEYCRKNWWTNVLFIQNYVNAKEMCMLHAWYLPCDMHFFIITVFLIILIQKKRKVGVFLLYILTLVSILIPGIVTYAYDLIPILSFEPKVANNPRLNPSFEHLYVKSHTRATVYFLGILSAYYLFEKRKSTWKISKRVSVFLCVLGLGFLFAPMAYGSTYYNPRKEYNLAESVVFSIFRRLSWGFAWVVFMFVNRFGEIPIFGKVFTWKISVPLSKTTYGVYLIHFLIQYADQASVKIPYQFVSFNMFVKGTNDLFFATGYALVLYLIIELPFRLIFKELLFPSGKEKPRVEPKNEDVPAKPDPNSPMIFSIKL